jgi:hypothetical protein
MAINYNVNPYYDDYNQEKQFYRILFRPGRAVQARELTQLQTSLQKQIEQFGQSIYKEGSIVIPGGLNINRRLPYANLTSSFGSNVSDTLISSLINDTITGQSSNVKAIIVNYQTSTTAGDPSTIYIQYTSSNTTANGTNTTFQAGETIKNISGNITLQIANTAPTGLATQVSVTNGVLFTKGFFAYYDSQNYILDKYNQANNSIVGFEVGESTVEATNDTSLLDPAIGASNYIAPGADRYKIALDLAKRPLTVNPNNDPNFVELARIEDGQIISNNLNPQYSILGQTLARRTFDESGDYTVNSYDLNITNHLRTSNTVNDGLLLSSEGGDDNKFVNIIEPGKSYVRGYEIDNVRSRYLIGNKARDFANVNNGIIATTIGNYIFVTNVFSIPDLSLLPTVSFYNSYNVTPGTANGNAIGTGKIRGFELYSGTPGTATAIYKLWLFDVTMSTGYVFEKDIKQIYVDNSGYSDFTADISPTLTILTGSVTTANVGSNTVTGIATRFNDELKVNDFITINSVKFKVTTIANSSSITVTPSVVSNLSGTLASVDSVVYNDNQNLLHLFELPYSTIKTVDPTNLETSYGVKRSYSRTLSSNSVTISAGTDETFDSISTTNYVLVVKSGANSGQYLNPSSFVSRGSGGSSVTINLSSLANNPTNVANYSTADVSLVAKLTKTNTSADKKTKTLVSNATIDYINANTAQAATISLAKADAFQLVSVKMSNVAFGSAYSTSGQIDITSRYTFDNGQKPTYYDVGSISLKPNQAKPTGPIRIKFDYFTHGTGDYFSVDSYSGINYKDIPSFTHSGKTYQLRDCLDFRPRINDAGTGFTGTGAVVNDFLDSTSDVLTDYSYYLPRIDKIVLDKDGVFKLVSGISSLNPNEPQTPEGSMSLFVLNQKPYVFDINEDIDITEIDNRRYTMRDIGRIENRVKNLEYYTSLNLLERNTQALQIQDTLGFDRFKNGFIVDNFTGHGIGDVYNRDYGVAIDYNKQELRPLANTTAIALSEINTSDSARTANNYVSANGIITLPYTHTQYIKNQKASRTENINPFSVITWLGKVTLNPPGDFWFEDTILPAINKNEEGNYDQFLKDVKSKGTYGAVWGGWQSVFSGTLRTDTRTGVSYDVAEKIDTKTNNNVIVSKSIIPKMRSKTITFTGEGLKPNTRLKVFFDNINITNYCSLDGTANAETTMNTNSQRYGANNIVTNSEGKVVGLFSYNSNALNLNTGVKSFRLTDSPTNASDFETLAETVFDSSGELRQVRDEIISVRNAVLNAKDIVESQTVDTYVAPDPPNPPNKKDYVDILYQFAFGRAAEPGGKAYWSGEVQKFATERGFASMEAIVSNARVTNDLVRADGSVYYKDIDPGLTNTGANAATKALFEITNFITQIGSHPINREYDNPNGLMGAIIKDPTLAGSPSKSAEKAAAVIATAIASRNSGFAIGSSSWAADVAAAAINPITAQVITTSTGSASCTQPGGMDPLAQTFFVDTALYLTKMDLYFSSKDSTVPMRIQIRKVVNGVPGPYIIPLSETVVYPANINISDDSSIATSINFNAPVYLDAGEYAIVLLADSINYRVWISQINENDVITNSLISEQPYIGVLFKSQNASTWSPDQYQDLKFTLYRAAFDTSVTGVVEYVPSLTTTFSTLLEQDPFEVYPNSNIMRIYHPKHSQNTGSSIIVNGWTNTNTSPSYTGNGSFFGIDIYTQLYNRVFTIDNVTLDSYTITLPQSVGSNVSSILRTGNYVVIENDFKYDSICPTITSVVLPGTSLANKIKTTSDITYSLDSNFTTISVNTNDFTSPKTLASNVNRSVAMSNAQSLIYRTELSTTTPFLSPIIDTKKLGVILIRNLVNNPTYNNTNFAAANDIVTIANANNIVVTQVSGAEGRITLTSTQDKINAVGIIKGTYLNISANNGVNNGQYRVLNVTDNGSNISIYNVSTQNVSTNATATYTITNGRNFIAEEAAYGGSAYSKYITREVSFVNPCTSFKFYLDVAKPTEANLKFYYKVSEVGDTINLTEKEYTEITSVTVPTSLDGTFNEVQKIVENLPQFDAIIFKIVFLGTNSSQVAKCKNLRVIALA